MVVIEQEPEDRKQNVENPPKASSDSTVNENGDASDGFETASERDVSDGESDDDEQKQEEHPIAPAKPEDRLNDDESKQKALAEANEAKLEGNKLFGEGKYEEALSQYEVALRVASVPEVADVVSAPEKTEMASAPERTEVASAPEKKEVSMAPEVTELRSICHSNRGICFLKLGKYEESIKECTKALQLNPSYMKALVRRAEAHEKLEHFEEAIADLKKILELDPSNSQARRTIVRLEPLAAAKREKMKEEMIGKLKEMGNSILGRFGMSVDNFKAVQDPNTGSYSISFQR
ncbi:tetratricopeptide repeat protein 1-like [Melia azedarach]|uniref:Tetratricopeptide repeat protein 1-like n=1 Tax=Melia azedarach TaxID=155640 RepID=A0ACC1XDH8_MELAZ|nr:tetratricopeptide repeat protein 1-like [Melia azedarach]